MRFLRAPGAALTLILMLLARSEAAQIDDFQDHAEFWKGTPEAGVIRACAPGSPPHWNARDALRRFERQVAALSDDAPVTVSTQRLARLLRQPCFELAFESLRVPRVDSVPALRAWLERGGGFWLTSLLEMPESGGASHVVVPPDAPRTLVPRGSNHQSALDEFLCPLGDAACGGATRGWVLRAAKAIEQHALASLGDTNATTVSRPARSAQTVSDDCVRAATTEPDALRYEAWRACVENYRDVRALVPVAEFRAPTQGWLIVAGRRGHYDFCDTVRAFNLADGTALFDDSCSALALERDGSVNREKTNVGRVSAVRVGRVPVDALREAAWMLMFRHQFVPGQRDADVVPLPPGFERRWDRTYPPAQFSITRQSGWFSTAQTSLTWALAAGGQAFAGTVTWPSSSDGAEEHAAHLLEIAEAGFVPGCRLSDVPNVGAPQLTLVDRSAGADVSDLRTTLAAAAARWAKTPSCR